MKDIQSIRILAAQNYRRHRTRYFFLEPFEIVFYDGAVNRFYRILEFLKYRAV